jgi:alkaline phosphatase
MKHTIIAFFMLLVSSAAFTQPRKYTMQNVHSHNDYEQSRPFYTAYEFGAGSIEADILLRDGELYVAHDSAGIRSDRTLAKMYLEPLQQMKSIRKLILLIDIKTAAQPTLEALTSLVKKYDKLTGSNKLKIVISGNRPPIDQWTSYPAWVFFDGRPNENYDEAALARVGMISDNFKRYSDEKKLDEVVKQAHKLKKPIRFWATAANAETMIQLMKLRVDLINTDNIQETYLYLQMQ